MRDGTSLSPVASAPWALQTLGDRYELRRDTR